MDDQTNDILLVAGGVASAGPGAPPVSSSSSSSYSSCSLFPVAADDAAADHDDLHIKYGIDVAYLTQEDVIKFKQSFWNVTQNQTDRLYSFYYKQEDAMVQRASHLRRVILGRDNLVVTPTPQQQGHHYHYYHQQRRHPSTSTTSSCCSPPPPPGHQQKKATTGDQHPSCNHSSNKMLVAHAGGDDGCTVSSSAASTITSSVPSSKHVLTDVIQSSEVLLDDIKSIMEFLTDSKKNYQEVLTAFDDYHGTNVKEIELAALEESHTFLDGSRLKVLMDLIIEDVINEAEKKLIMMDSTSMDNDEAPTSTSAAGGATVLGDHCIVPPSCDNDRYEQKKSKRGGGRLTFLSLCSCLLIGRSTSTRRRDNKISGRQQSEEGNCSSKQDSNVSTTARIKDKSIATATGKKKQARRKPRKDTSLLLSTCNQDTLISDKSPSDLEQGKRSTVLRDSLTSIFHWRVLEKG